MSQMFGVVVLRPKYIYPPRSQLLEMMDGGKKIYEMYKNKNPRARIWSGRMVVVFNGFTEAICYGDPTHITSWEMQNAI